MGLLTLFRPRKDLATRMVEGEHLVGRKNPFEQFQVRSLVAKDMVIDGNITSATGAALDGTVNGDVTITGKNTALLVRIGARVRGDVRAPMVLVRGEVDGDIEARFVRLFPGSQVNGSIRAARLLVDTGATISNGTLGVNRDMALPDVAPAIASVHELRVPAVSSEERMQQMLVAVSGSRR